FSFCFVVLQLSGAPRPLVVRVVNSANVPQDVLTRARMEVERIYARSGVPIIWKLETPSDAVYPTRPDLQAFQVIVVITPRCINTQTCQNESATGTALGSNGIGTQRAYIFADRVFEIALKFRKRIAIPEPEGLVMGHAIAHEVGHLLLSPGHSESGLMTPEFNLQRIQAAVRGDLLFTPEQNERMRAVLLGMTETSR